MNRASKILEHIASTGDCEDLRNNPCKACPLAKLKQRENGTGWLSCYESTGAFAAGTVAGVIEAYKAAAKQKILEIAIEKELGANMRKINEAGMQLVKSFEGCKLTAYADPASPLGKELLKVPNARSANYQNLPGDPWTVGYGATGLDPYSPLVNGKHQPISPSTKWTQSQADEALEKDLQGFCDQVCKLLKVEVNDNQLAALTSFAYNCGLSNLKQSTLLKMVNQKKFDIAADEFLKWNKARGQELPGLTRRREAERRLFLS
jgi:lysozyme